MDVPTAFSEFLDHQCGETVLNFYRCDFFCLRLSAHCGIGPQSNVNRSYENCRYQQSNYGSLTIYEVSPLCTP